MTYSLDFEVRDYECDLQGIVNNANYLHYLEHTRHKFLRSHGVSFAELHTRGIDLVVARYNLEYKSPLHAEESFRSELSIEKVGLKYRFHQRIVRVGDEKLCLKAVIDSVAIINGKLSNSEELDTLLGLSGGC